MASFPLQQETRDHTHHAAVALQGGIGHQAHQAHPTAAINQGYAFASQKLAQTCGDLPACGIGAETRATKDADGGGGGFHFSTRAGNGLTLFTDDPTSFRTGATWYHFAEEGRGAKWGRVVAPSGG